MSSKDIKDSSIEYIKESDIDCIFDNDLDIYIDQFKEKYNISDLVSISQNQWNGLLMYIAKSYIKPSGILKIKNDLHNRYNIPMFELLCDWYINQCSVNDKEISIKGFGFLCGVDDTLFYEWENNYVGRYDKASSDRSNIAKKLRDAREMSLSNKLLGGKNPVGVLGILNHFYGWNMPGVREAATKSAGTLADLQKRAGLLSDNSTQKITGTASGDSLELSDNSIQ